MNPGKDITGTRFGRLTAVYHSGWHVLPTGKRRQQWVCACDCGKTTEVLRESLRNGDTKSCGCLALDVYKTRNITHGHTRKRTSTPEYSTWRSIIARCNDPSSFSYQTYGGRGITLCRKWSTSFEAFLKDMGARPKGTSIDRINPNGNYTPSNCRWATRTQQARNTTVNRRLECRGETLCLAEWAERLGSRASVIHNRIKVLRWPLEKALTSPVRRTTNKLSPTA